METPLAPAGYRIEKRLHAGVLAVVYSAVRESDGSEVALKTYPAESSTHGDGRARREFEILRSLEGHGVVRAIELIESSRSTTLVLERATGVALGVWARKGSLPAPHDFLEVAIQLAGTLAAVHGARYLHRDLHPGNIIVDPVTRATRLIDFGGARRQLQAASRGELSRTATSGFAGTLHFIAPEQTGRMDRGIDHRSDLYGLGATLYFALTGTPPFEGNDPLALIHSHIARVPEPPIARRPDLPLTLSRIALKLLHKEPEDRYQTAHALQRDLQECLAQLERSGRIDDALPLGSADAPARPLFAKRLYGREAELGALHAAYERVAQGRTELVLLSGAPGSGKSALVHELRRRVASTGGYLASGKFDLYRRDVPYSGWSAALDSLAHQILAESEAQLAQWREELRAALGNIAGALVERVPNLAHVLGEVPAIPELGPRETQARIVLAMQRFLRCCARAGRPLVLLLDDLQWADPASRDLLGALLTESPGNTEGVALMVLGSYRDSEVGPTHPLTALLELLQQAGRPPNRVELPELSLAACAQMLADALDRPLEQVGELSAAIVRKTGSNPLLVQQFVLHLHALGLIHFVHPEGWTWDDAQIAGAAIPEGAVAMLMAKLGRLEAQARGVIEFASCVGDEFDLERLLELSGRPQAELESSLFALLEEGLIAPSAAGFRFVHDRIREAALALVPAAERRELHRRLAGLLHTRTSAAELPGRAFEIADHWNHALEALGDEERAQALAANAAAGRRALGAGAATTAATYFAAARALFQERDWERDPGFAFALFAESTEALYQTRAFDPALQLLDGLQTRPLDPAQRIRVDALRITILTVVAADRAVDVTLAVLRRLGIRFPKRPSLPRALASIMYTRWRLGDPRDEFRARGAPPPSWELQAPILAAGGSAMLRSNVLLVSLATNYALRMQRRHGIGEGLALGLAAFAGAWVMVGGANRFFQQLVEAALHWIERMPTPAHMRARFSLETFSLHLLRPRRALLDSVARTEEILRELGDVDYAGYAARQHLHYMILCGDSLDAAFAAAPRVPAELRPPLPPYRVLVAGDAHSIDWNRELAASEESLRDIPPLYSTSVRLHWVFALCFFGEYARAETEAARFAKDVNNATSMAAVGEWWMLRGLYSAALAETSRGVQRRRRLRALRRAQAELRRLAVTGPDYAHLLRFLEAEHARARGSTALALRSYGPAAERARELGFRQHAALIHERRADLLRRGKRSTEALAALRQALDLYREWGADSKVKQLEQACAELRRGGRA